MNILNPAFRLVAFAISLVLLRAAELPVRAVVLYKHGIGYFERAGTLNPGESARLEFKAEEMNDVLKSLTVNETGGSITGLRYDSSIPLDEKLTAFPFRINNGDPLSALIDQLKGARIEMEFGAQKTAGLIVSARLIPGDKERPEREPLTILLDSGELRNMDLAAATAIRFADPRLQAQFKDYLAAVNRAQSKDKRTLYIDSTGSKARDLQVAYILPMPAWKTSYRLLFDDKSYPTLEGWAIIDNTSGEDWTGVRMSLVSGKPISFVSQLYAPKYVSRLGAELPEDQPIAPPVYTGAVEEARASSQKAPNALRMGGDAFAGRAGVAGGVPGGAPPLPAAQMSSIGQTGSGQEIADLFQYSIAAPVTVRKDESAMLPFLQQEVSARRLLIYSDSSKPNPLSAAELTNNTGKTLDGGPLTVYDSGAYVGEALVETIKTGDKRFIGYGVDLGTRIATNLDSRNDDVRELHARNGLLIATAANVQKKTYSVRNVDARFKTLILEHPVRSGYLLIDTPKPMETARDVYRFELKLPPSGSVEFPVTEEHVYDTQISVSSLNADGLLTWARNRRLPENARGQLQQIAAMKTHIAAADTEKRSITDQVAALSRDEERNRQNIATLSGVSGQQAVVQDYARKLSDQEIRIASLRDREAALDQQRAASQEKLNGLIENLAF